MSDSAQGCLLALGLCLASAAIVALAVFGLVELAKAIA